MQPQIYMLLLMPSASNTNVPPSGSEFIVTQEGDNIITQEGDDIVTQGV